MSTEFLGDADEFHVKDLHRWESCLEVTRDIEHVYVLAANIEGIGFLTEVKSAIMHDNVLTHTHTLEAARQNGGERLVYSSSACIYPTYRQEEPDNLGPRETDAYPADPANEYGWEKAFIERLCSDYRADYRLETRIGRCHNVYGPYGTYEGGREKAPAAICRKVAQGEGGDAIDDERKGATWN